MFNNIKYFIISISLLTSAWTAEFTSPSAAIEIADESAEKSVSLASVEEIVEEVSSPKYATQDTVFERVITLGSDCAAKKQVNEFFAPQNNFNNTKKGHADLFDWMIMRDYDLLAEALSNNLTDFFEKGDFAIEPHITNTKYKMDWIHIFHEANAQLGWVSIVSGDRSVFFDGEFPNIKQKMNYLRDKFIDAKNKKTLYIISEKYSFPNKETLCHLRNSLILIRQGNKDFAILFVTKKQRFSSFENILVRESTKIMPCGWDGGDNLRWREILNEFKFTPDIWA